LNPPAPQPYDFPDYVEESVAIWNQNAEWWDDQIGAGNEFQVRLIEPTTHDLLDVQPGEEVIDLACGAGRVARQIADRGGRVTAIDHADRFIKRARERSSGYGDALQFRVANAADFEQMLKLGKARFDAAVITMAMMDMAVISTPIAALSWLLKPGGRAVFSVTHPAFNSSDADLVASRTTNQGRTLPNHRVAISRYAESYALKGEGVLGQPALQWYFHRPIGTLIEAWTAHGFVVDAVREPCLAPRTDTDRWRLSWNNLPEMPPILVMRLRLT
jgi:ubiquinone/menaquinone biosynthesis C-methylase UbiE